MRMERKPPTVDKEELVARARFRHQLRLFERFTEEACAEQGVTLAQYLMLLQVAGRPERDWALIGELAECLVLRHHTAVELAGHVLPPEQKLLLSFGAANRDPRRWPDPDRFDIDRRPVGHLAFGSGIHACVGQLLARAEAETLLEELARSVAQLELCGAPQRWLNNAVHSWASVPLRIR